MYTKLVDSCWHHWTIVLHIVAGDLTVAHIMFFNWLVIADQGIRVNDYCWPSNVIELKGHTDSNQTIEVNICEYLEYLTKVADPKAILGDPLIKNRKDMWWK